MKKRAGYIIGACLLIVLIYLFFAWQNNQSHTSDKTSTISAIDNDTSEVAFKKLGFDYYKAFEFTQYNADKAYVHIWLEAYQNGNQVALSTPISLQYGLSPEEMVKGNIEFAISNMKNQDQAFVYLYSGGARIEPTTIDTAIFENDSIYAWKTVIDENTLNIEYDTPICLAIYYGDKDSLSTVGQLQDEEQMSKLIGETDTVLMLKMSVTERGFED